MAAGSKFHFEEVFVSLNLAIKYLYQLEEGGSVDGRWVQSLNFVVQIVVGNHFL